MINHYIRQYGKRLYGLCLTLCADTFDAEDLYQDTWLKVVKNFSRYDTTQPFEPWITQICVNTYRNTLRRIMRSPIFNAFGSEDEKNAVMERISVPEPIDYSDLYDAINKLPEKLRITVILFYFQEMDIATVGNTLEIPTGTVKSRLNKAGSILKEVLTDETDIRL